MASVRPDGQARTTLGPAVRALAVKAPAVKARSASASGAPAAQETTALPEAVPEPEAPSEDARRSAEAAGHHVAGGDLSRENQGPTAQNGELP